ncbi:MAG: phosphomannomutase/phosphoglucomutase [Desulfobacterales bacterium]|nr:phosphomannomutase/phosphoglucomutase [Desulfobacterales bacterium]
MDSGIFREYDIRGVAGKDLDKNDVKLIGKGIGTYLLKRGNRKVSVGKDCRQTSDEYTDSLVEGLLSTGCDVMEIGVCPTPILYFSIHHFELEGGVMVTASHNPPEYNGFKLCSGTDSIHGKGILEIWEIIQSGKFETGSGQRTDIDAITPYLEFVRNNISINTKLKVGVDAGNGTGGVVAVPLLKEFGMEVKDIYCDMDGTFPNHEADPTVAENMQDLIKLVKENSLDIGIGYDGDTDRIGVVDEKGNLVYGDQLMIIFSREILERKPGSTFISEVKCSKTLYDDIEKNGGRGIMWKTGHSLIKEKMKIEKAELAGEMSGHIFFKDRFFGFDDAIYSTLRLLEILDKTGKKMSELLEDIPETFNTPEIRVECPDNLKFKLTDKVTAYFKEKYEVIDIDGMRVLFDDGWGLIRASNTQPALVLRFEALSEKRLYEIKDLVESNLSRLKNEME